MAKPRHTAYQVQANFDGIDMSQYLVAHEGPVGLDPSCITGGRLKMADRWRRTRDHIIFATAEDGHITFGYDKAEALLKECRKCAKEQFKKGGRPAFFLRKLTMSDFMAHKGFKNYKNDATVKSVFKKYQLMDLLSEKGFQMS